MNKLVARMDYESKQNSNVGIGIAAVNHVYFPIYISNHFWLSTAYAS